MSIKQDKKIESRKTYKFFKNELEELLKLGFTKKQSLVILSRIDKSIDTWQGYGYAHVAYTAHESLEYLIKQETITYHIDSTAKGKERRALETFAGLMNEVGKQDKVCVEV